MKLTLAIGALSQAVLVDARFSKHLSSLKRFERRNNEGPLWSGNVEKFKDNGEECDPNSDLDLGLLSCGEGRFCAQSVNSVLGGFCSPISKGDRSLQGCPSDAFTNYNCDCSNYVEGMGGPITDCVVFTNTCETLEGFSGGSEVCFDLTYELTIRPPDTGLFLLSEAETFCYNVNSPYSRELCVSNTYDSAGTRSGCELAIDGVTCNRCAITTCQSDGTENLIFDCSNTVIASSGNECNNEFPLPIVGYIVDETDSPTTPVPVGDTSPTSAMPVSGGQGTSNMMPTKEPGINMRTTSSANAAALSEKLFVLMLGVIIYLN